MKAYYSLFILSFLFVVFPHTTEAYLTTKQEAFSVDGTTGVFSIEYRFGHQNRSIHMPLHPTNSESSFDHYLSYSIYDDEGEHAQGDITSIILSNADIVGDEYVVKESTLRTFTLLVIFTPNDENLGTEYHLQVEHLPFTFDGTGKQRLNQSELQYYKTERLTLLP